MENLNQNVTFFSFMKDDFFRTIDEFKGFAKNSFRKIAIEIDEFYSDYKKSRIKDLTKNTIKVPVNPHPMFYFYKHGSEIFTYFLSYFVVFGFMALSIKNVGKSYVMIPLLIFSIVGLVFLTTKLKYYFRRWSK